MKRLLQTDVTETWTRMANCHQNMGNLETAVELYENVLDENPGDFDAKFALSTIYEELGRSEVARQLLEEAEALSMQAQIAAKEKEEEEERRIAAMSSISNRKSMNKDRMLQLSEEKNRIRETQELYNKASHLLKNLEDASSRVSL